MRISISMHIRGSSAMQPIIKWSFSGLAFFHFLGNNLEEMRLLLFKVHPDESFCSLSSPKSRAESASFKRHFARLTRSRESVSARLSDKGTD